MRASWMIPALCLAACTPAEPARAPAPAPEPVAPKPEAHVARAPSVFVSSAELLALRDPRRYPALRPRRVLVVEIQGLESTLAAMPVDAPDRPALMFTLAGAYAELARLAEQDGLVPGNPEAAKAEKIAFASRTMEIKNRLMLVQRYPTWCARPNGGCVDETAYFAGLACERLGKLDDARKLYLTTLQSHPDSRFAAHAFLAFGELFIPEAERDPSKWTLARQSFEEVVKLPPPGNELYGYGLLRLGQIYQRLGKREAARAAFGKLALLAEREPGWGSVQIAAKLIPPGMLDQAAATAALDEPCLADREMRFTARLQAGVAGRAGSSPSAGSRLP
jgi:tetratricopeptide (TPR) repeat protein